MRNGKYFQNSPYMCTEMHTDTLRCWQGVVMYWRGFSGQHLKLRPKLVCAVPLHRLGNKPHGFPFEAPLNWHWLPSGHTLSQDPHELEHPKNFWCKDSITHVTHVMMYLTYTMIIHDTAERQYTFGD